MTGYEKIDVEHPLETAREAFWLAYTAAKKPSGMGMLQAKGDADRYDVFDNVMSEGDYPGTPNARPGEFNGDYVFGRMLKLNIRIRDGAVYVPDRPIQHNYQSWASCYDSYRDLVECAAVKVAEMDEDDVETLDESIWDKLKSAFS